MKLLLDTHTLLWLAHEPDRLSPAVSEALCDATNDVLISAVSAMEIATKYRAGKLEYPTSLARNFVSSVTAQGFTPLSITCDHAERAGNLEWEHKDPWDRLLAAQSQLEGARLVTIDVKLTAFAIDTFW